MQFKILDKKECVDCFLSFHTDSYPLCWRNVDFVYFHPQWDKEKGLYAPEKERLQYLETIANEQYDLDKEIQATNLKGIQKIWAENEKEIIKAFDSVFGIDSKKMFDQELWATHMCSVAPRYLESKSFTTCYYDTDFPCLLSIAIHESVHFAWFDIWHQEFKDDFKEYETPHIKWYLSEMVVDTIAKNSDLKNFFEKKYRPAYTQFYNIPIDGKELLETLSSLYKNKKNMVDFMHKSFDFVAGHQKEICRQYDENTKKMNEKV